MTDEGGRGRRPGRRSPPTTPDAIEIAMEAEASGEAPTGEASALLRRQSALVGKQVILAGNEIFRNRIRAIRDTAIAAMVVALVVALGAVVWSASRTTGLVVQPFSVPPELVEDGLDGRAVAALFLDELVRLDTTTSSTRTPANFRNDWSEAVTVEVEAGGLSITDAYTSLTRLLGSEIYVSGGLSRTTTGLELVIRSSEGWSVTVQGPADRREDLIRQAAGQVYEQSQPIRYASQLLDRAEALPDGPERQMLIERGRTKLTTLLSGPSEITRIWAYINLSQLSDTSLESSIVFLQRAFELDPEHPSVVLNLSDDFYEAGKWELSIQHSRIMSESISKPANLAKLNSKSVESYFFDTEARLAHLTGDRLREIEFYNRLISMELPVSYIWRERRTQALIGLHEPPSLSRLLEDDALRAASGAASTNLIYFLRADAAASLDQWPQAVAALEASVVETEAVALRFRPVRQISIWPRLAYARARTGDLAGAQALIAATPLDCYLCVRERARIAELAGDRAAADRWSAEARRQGPSLPFAFAERGQMLAARGDPAGAIRFFEQAIERGPRWADPQKFWGDALMAQGDEAGAIRKYRAAAERAPQWGALHLAWGRALEAQGRRDQARETYAAAAGMDLSATDRAEVVRRLGAVGAGEVIPHSVWPVDPGVILPFLLAVLLIELTPGPNMGWLALVAAGRGRAAGLAAVAGVTLGLTAWMLAAVAGLTQILLRAPTLYQGLRWAGVAFLLWLAWEAWRVPPDRTAPVDEGTKRGLFLRGLMGNLLNPKAAVFYVALLPGFIRPDHGAAWVQALWLGGMHVAIAIAVHVAIVLGADKAGQATLARAQGPWVRGLMAGGIAVVALWTAWQTR